MERIGIIGVGEIGRAIVAGLYDGDTGSSGPSGISEPPGPPEVALSPRGARTSAELAERYTGARVCADNQEVVDRSDLLIVAVRRADRHAALAGLRVPAATTVINVMAGVATAELREILATDAPIVRAIPLPTVRERRSVTVTYPAHPVVDAFFTRLGGALPVADEATYNVMSALTGTLTSHLWYLTTLASWAAAHGVPADDADRYVRGLFQGVARALGDGSRTLDRIAADHETPNGNNERVRTTWFDAANAAALTRALDDLLADLGERGA